MTVYNPKPSTVSRGGALSGCWVVYGEGVGASRAFDLGGVAMLELLWGSTPPPGPS